MKMLQRVMHLGILEPLKNSILENLSHKCPYVRRNSVSLLSKIYENFKDDLTPDIDIAMEKILKTETDLSVKRNGLFLLIQVNLEKAFNFI